MIVVLSDHEYEWCDLCEYCTRVNLAYRRFLPLHGSEQGSERA